MTTPSPCPLNTKQLEAVQWLANGKTADEIGTITGITKFAVQKRLQLAKEIVGVGKDTALVAIALRHGWIQ